MAKLPSADYSRGLALAGQRILLADGNAGLRVVEMVEMVEMKETRGAGLELRFEGVFRTARPANRVSLLAPDRTLALVAEDSAGIVFFDLSRPEKVSGY
jgi:hypothetical protein